MRGWFPGYTVVGVASLAFVATAPGQTFILSQLNLPLSTELSITPLTLNTAYTIATVASALPLVWLGRGVDHFGPRRAMALIALLVGLSCLAMSAARGLFTVFLGFLLLRFFAQGGLALVSQHAVAMWFHRRLGAMQGIKQVVVFAAWAPLPLATTLVIGQLGWRSTYVLFGAVVAALVAPIALVLLRDRPEAVGLTLDGDAVLRDAEPAAGLELPWTTAEAMTTRAYWVIAAVFFAAPLIGTAMLFDLQPILLSRGLSPLEAAAPVTAWTLTMAGLAIPSGMLTDRLRPRALLTAGTLFFALGPLILCDARHVVTASAAMVSFGVGQSLVASAGGAALARFYGRAHHGAIRASIARIGVVGTGLGPIVTGLGLHLTGAYGAPLLALGLFGLLLCFVARTVAAPVRGSAS